MHKKTLLILLSITLAFGGLFARVGESRSSLEGRLVRSQLAVPYPDDRIMSKAKDNRVPYRHVVDYFPEDCQHAIYYKKTGNDKPIPAEIAISERQQRRNEEVYPEGWELHVVYLRNTSIFEAYRRNGQGGFEEVEVMALLDLSANNWQHAQDPKEPSVIGYQYVTEDGKLRARRYHDTVIVYMKELDVACEKRRDAVIGERAEEIKKTLPAELNGF